MHSVKSFILSMQAIQLRVPLRHKAHPPMSWIGKCYRLQEVQKFNVVQIYRQQTSPAAPSGLTQTSWSAPSDLISEDF